MAILLHRGQETFTYDPSNELPSCGALTLTITANPENFCGNEEVTLTASEGFTAYKWADDETIEDRERIIYTPGTYVVMATAEDGCSVSQSIEVRDLTEPSDIKDFFESRGFYRIEVELPDVTAFNSANSGRSNSTICEDDFSFSESVFVSDGTPLGFNIGGEEIQNLQALLENNLNNHFVDITGDESAKAFITSNEAVCSCTNEKQYLQQVEEQYNKETVGFALWIHLYENAEGEDCLFIQAKNSGGIHAPSGEESASLDDLLAGLEGNDFLADGFASLGEQKLFTIQNVLLEETLGDSFVDEPEVVTPGWVTVNADCSTPYHFLTSRGGILTIEEANAATITGYHIVEDILHHVLVGQKIYKVLYKNNRDLYSTQYQRTNIPILVDLESLAADPNFNSFTAIFGSQEEDEVLAYGAVEDFDQYVFPAIYTDICDKIENITIVKSNGNCGHPTDCPGDNTIPPSDELCDLLDGEKNVEQLSEDIQKAATALMQAMTARNELTTEKRPHDKYHHIIASEGSSMVMPEEKAKVLDEKLFLLQAHTEIPFFVLYHETSEPIAKEAREAFAQLVAEQAGFPEDGVLITVPYNINIEVLEIKTCGQPGLYDHNGKVTDEAYKSEKTGIFDYAVRAFSAISKPANISLFVLLSDQSIIKFHQSSSKEVVGFSSINDYKLFRSIYVEQLYQKRRKRPVPPENDCNQLEDAGERIDCRNEYEVAYETFTLEDAQWQAEYEALQDKALREELIALNREFPEFTKQIFKPEPGKILLRESYMHTEEDSPDAQVPTGYAAFHYDNNNTILAPFMEWYGVYPFDDKVHTHGEITPHEIVYNTLDGFSIVLGLVGLDFIPDVAGLIYTAAFNNGDTGKFVEYGAAIVFPASMELLSRVASEGLKGFKAIRRVNQDGTVEYLAIPKDEVLKDGDLHLYSIFALDALEATRVVDKNLDKMNVDDYTKFVDEIATQLQTTNSTLEKTNQILSELLGSHPAFFSNPALFKPALAELLVKAGDAERKKILGILGGFENEAKIGKFTDDLAANLGLVNEFSGNPELIRAWEMLTNANAPDALRRSILKLNIFNELIKNDEYLTFFRTLDNNSRTWPVNLDLLDESVIKFWTTKDGYGEFNQLLINGGVLSPFFENYNNSLIAALNKLDDYVIPSNRSLYRGTVIDASTVNQKYTVGNSFPENFYTATSKRLDIGEQFLINRMVSNIDDIENGVKIPVFFRVSGNKGKDISSGSLADEGEVLFRPGNRREVIDITPATIDDPQRILDELGPTYFNLVNDFELEGLEYLIITLKIID